MPESESELEYRCGHWWFMHRQEQLSELRGLLAQPDLTRQRRAELEAKTAEVTARMQQEMCEGAD